MPQRSSPLPAIAGIVVLVAVAAGAVVWLVKRGPGLPTAGQQPSATQPAAPPVEPVDPAHPRVTFDDGTIAVLDGIRSFKSDSPDGWGADGSVVPMDRIDDAFHRSVGFGDTAKSHAVEVRVVLQTDQRGTKSYTIRFPQHRTGGATWYKWDGPDVLFMGIYSFPTDLQQTPIEVGLASGEWTDVDTLHVADAATRAQEAAPFATKPTTRPQPPTTEPATTTPFRILSITENAGATQVECTNTRYWPNFNQAQWQVMLRDKHGRDHKYNKVNYPGGRMTFIYNVPLTDADAVVYQERPWQWKPLGIVRLFPATQPSTQPAAGAATRD